MRPAYAKAYTAYAHGSLRRWIVEIVEVLVDLVFYIQKVQCTVKR
jgi:hypothetical protein